MPRPDNHVIVVSGATGDLARRKLLPGLFHLATAGLMPDRYQIIGVSPQDMTGEQFRELACQAIADFGTAKPTGAAWQAFQRRLSFASADPARTLSLVEAIAAAERQVGGSIGLAILGTVAWTVVASTARNSAAAAAAAATAGHPLASTATQVKTAIYDHALSAGFGRGSEVSAGIMLIALIITIAAVRSGAPTWPAPRLRRPARPGTTRAPRCSRPGNRPGRASRLMTGGSDGRVLIA